MGRKARIRKQRKQSQQGKLAENQTIATQASTLAKQADSSSEETKEDSFLEGLLDKINPFPKVDVKSRESQIDAAEFTEENKILIAAVAWEGYLESGKGLVVIKNFQETAPTFEYIPQRFLPKKLRPMGVHKEDIQMMRELCNSYEPTETVTMMYIDDQGEVSLSSSPQSDPSPKKCYRLIQEQLQQSS